MGGHAIQGDIVSDVMDFAVKRLPGIRIKHRVKQNWIKMYNKAGSVLRLEMVINDPTAFKMRKKVCRHGKHVMEWVDMRKGVAYMFRYREVSLAAQRPLPGCSGVSGRSHRCDSNFGSHHH
jgi:hypothetical protein